MEIEGLTCCAIQEIDRPCKMANDSLAEICRARYVDENTCAFYIYSAISGEDTGQKNLTKYIKSEKLGEVLKTKSSINPNSGNRITVWIWRVNKKNLKAWWNKYQK